MYFKKCLPILTLMTALASAQDCVWNKDIDFPSYPPLLIDKDTWVSLKAKNEAGQRIVRISNGQSIVVACSKTVITRLGVEVTEGVCAGGNFLDINGTQYTIRDLACLKTVGDASLHRTGTCGNNDNGIPTALGFVVVGYQFYPTADICFQPDAQITIYSRNVIYGESVTASDGNPSKPSFRTDSYFYPTLNPNDCYLTANQDAYFTQLTGNPDFIDLNSGTNYFARGHLAPNGDYLVDMEADSSYYYTNAMPQWQGYNAGNWMYLEGNARDLAVKYTYNLTAWTGPWGRCAIEDVNNNPVNVSLCSSQNQEIIPIPELIWKVLYEPVSDTGIAVITSNHPYQVTAPAPVCPDIGCLSLGWIKFDPNSLILGFTYCCTVQDFYAVNQNAPSLPTAGILTDPPTL